MKIYKLYNHLSDEKLEAYFQQWMKFTETRDLTEYEDEHLCEVVSEIHWREREKMCPTISIGDSYQKVRF
jgi:hypothetical protein